MTWVRSRDAFVGGCIAAAALLIGGASSAAQSTQAPGCGPAPPGVSVTFDYEAPKPDSFTVPPGVHALAVTVQGGHGGSGDHTANGGPAGLVDATIPVTPGECLSVYVAAWGTNRSSGGGFGWARGGVGGENLSGATGSSGAAGGGASALVRGKTPLVVAGGGGGGGGDGTALDCFTCNFHQWGGAGGAGGHPPRNGNAADHVNGGDGGRGGFSKGSAGGEGGVEDGYPGGGGGGGGGFPKGGTAGSFGDINQQTEGGGGGGGGGGDSQVTADAHALQPPEYHTSTSSCPYKHFKPTCHGVVEIHWHTSASPLLLPLTPLAPPAPVQPLLRVPTLQLAPIVNRGLAVDLSPGTTSLELQLFQRHRGKWRRVRELVVEATPSGSNTFSLTLPRRFRRALLRADRPHSDTAGRLRLDAIDLATGERVDRQQLVLR